MNAGLKDELSEIADRLTRGPGDEPGRVTCLIESACIFDACQRVKRAWNAALFADVTDQCLNRYFGFHLEGVSKLSDTLTVAPSDPSVSPAWEEALLELTDHLLKSYKGHLPDTATASVAYLRRWRLQHQTPVQELTGRLKACGLPLRLKDCLLSYILEMSESGSHLKFSFTALVYFERFLTLFSAQDLCGPDAEALVNDNLIRLNFNHLEYYVYRQNEIEQKCAACSYLGKLACLDRELGHLRSLPSPGSLAYHPDWPSIHEMLYKLLLEKVETCKHVRLSEHDDRTVQTEKLALQLSVAQLACLIRLFYEEGLLASANLTEIFRVSAAVFRTKRQEHISPGSLSKEFYGIGQVNAAVLRDKLLKMVARINRNFFPV